MDTMACFVYRILFLGVVMCITASANLMVDYNWPVPDPNINRFPHESSCHYYYLMLSEDDISIEKCPDGQLFDYTKHNCIPDKEHIHCWSRHLGKIKHGHIIKHKNHFKCPYPWGKYPNLHDCTKYHLCLNGKSGVKKCAPFELFDKISRKCIASIDAVCADKSDVVEHGYVCPKAWGSFTYSKDCSKYYECLQRKASLRTCQKGYLFDDRLRKCSPKQHVYCGVRRNPYEKFSSVAPETSYAPSSVEASTIPSLEMKIISTKEEIASKESVSQKTKSVPQETSIAFKESTSNMPQTSIAFKESSSNMPKTSIVFKESTSNMPQTSMAFKESSSNVQETSIAFKEFTSFPQESSSNFQEVSSKQTTRNEPIFSKISSPSTVPENNNKETKQGSSIKPDTSTFEMSQEQQETRAVDDNMLEKNKLVETSTMIGKEQIKISSQTVSDDESENLKKDVSTEERDPNDIFSINRITAAAPENERSRISPDSAAATFTKTGCLPDDSMCLTEKDGTVVKCANSKDLQPHPKDERRFLDCTESHIQIFTCPPGLIFLPKEKKCRWQLVMGAKYHVV